MFNVLEADWQWNKCHPDWLSLQIALLTHMIWIKLWLVKPYPMLLHVTQSTSNSHGCHLIRLYIKPTECQEALGMENGAISDEQISASSRYSNETYASLARLFLQKTTYHGGGWAALTNDRHQWLQVDLNSQYRLTRVATQGRNSDDYWQWVTAYKLQYKDDGGSFQTYKELGQSTDKVE